MKKHGVSETKIKPALYKPQYNIPNSDRLPILLIKDQFIRQPFIPMQKPKSFLSSPIIERSTKNLRIMHEIKPVNSSDQSTSSLEQQRLLKRLQSRKESKNIPELMILKTNQDKRSYLNKPIIKENLVGEQAIQKFYQIYKQIDRRSQKEDFMNEKNAITKIINLLQIHNFTPKKLTFVKLKGKQAILDLKKLGVGQGSMGPFIVEIVTYFQYFQEIDLSYNRIDGVLGESFIQNLGKVKKIDLSHNRIGKIGCQKISELFMVPTTKIQQINLQQNNLLDSAGLILLQNLAQYNNIKKLNLNKNYMGPKFALKLKQFLLRDKEMNELYLSWNEFSFKASKAILQGVAGNSNLKVFDLSWNKIDEDSIPILVQIFKCHLALRHIKLKSIPVLAQALKENQTIYGIHFEGNSGFIDHRGFLNATQKQFNQYPLPLIKGVIRKIDGIKPNIVNQFKGGNIRDVCWICHSWQQKYFDIAYSEDLQQQVRSINGTIECYIHFKHENFWAVRMMLNDTGNRFQIARMCPIGNIQFFFTFTLSNGTRKVVINPQYNSVQEQMMLNYSIGKIQIKETVSSHNQWFSDYEVDPLNQFYQPKIHIVPRFSQVKQSIDQQRLNIRQTQKVLAKRKVIREEKVKVSLKNLDEDDDFLKDKQNRDFDEVIYLLFRLFLLYIGIYRHIQEYLKKCIDFDIENSKISKIIKQQSKIEEFKFLMIKYYRYFKETFYYLSRSNPSQSGIYSINQLQFGFFLEEQKYITKRVTLPKIMLKLYSCLSVGDDQEIKGNKSETIGKKGDDKSLTKLISRPQFLEFLIRLAVQKWCTFKPAKKKVEQVNSDNNWDLTNKKSTTVQKNNQKEKKGKIPIKLKLDKKQQKMIQKVEVQVKVQQDQQQQNQQDKLKLKLPLSLMQGIQKTISSLKRYSDNYGSSRWRQQKYLKPDIMIVLKAYQEFIYNLYEKYSEAKFKTNKPKKIINLLTLEELKTLILDTEIKRTKQTMKQVDLVFLDSKRLEVEDGNSQYGLTLEQFQQCLARLSEMVWFSPIASPNNDLWEQQINRRNTPLFLRFQSLLVQMYYKLPQFHNKRMDKVIEKGIFQLQMQLIIQKIQRLSQKTGNFGLLRRNSILGEQSISLKEIIDQLREKYDKMVVHRQEEEEFFQDAVIQA